MRRMAAAGLIGMLLGAAAVAAAGPGGFVFTPPPGWTDVSKALFAVCAISVAARLASTESHFARDGDLVVFSTISSSRVVVCNQKSPETDLARAFVYQHAHARVFVVSR